MSDYLSRLVSRSFSLTAVIQPRLASRFEPLSYRSQVSMGLDEIGNEDIPANRFYDVKPAESVRELQKHSVGAGHKKNGLRKIKNDFNAVNALERVHRGGRSYPESSQGLPDLKSKIEPFVERKVLADSMQPPETKKIDTPILHNTIGKAQLQPLEPEIKNITIKKAAIEKAVSESVTSNVAVDGSAASLRTINEKKQSNIEQPVQMVAAEQTFDQRLRLPASHPFSSASLKLIYPSMTYVDRGHTNIVEMGPRPEPEHTIQVTIGRIEVRAANTQIKLRREASTPPAMSLDEYLGSRARRA